MSNNSDMNVAHRARAASNIGEHMEIMAEDGAASKHGAGMVPTIGRILEAVAETRISMWTQFRMMKPRQERRSLRKRRRRSAVKKGAVVVGDKEKSNDKTAAEVVTMLMAHRCPTCLFNVGTCRSRLCLHWRCNCMFWSERRLSD